MNSERGAWTFGPIAGFIIVILAIVGFFALCNESDGEVNTLGRLELASHEWDGGDQDYDSNYGSEDDRNRNRNRNRGAFSPGPFDDSPVDAFNNVCMPGATCHYDGRQGQEEPPR